MRITNRIAGLAVAVAAAGGLVLSGAAPALADINTTFVSEAVVSNSGVNAKCTALLMSTQVSAGQPAYVAADITNKQAGNVCTGWIERSANKGKAWSIISVPDPVPSAGTPTFVVTGNYYAGPGYISRVCVRLGLGATHCSAAVKLGHGSGKPVSDALPLSYLRHAVAVTNSIGQGCVADVASSTATKKASSDALGEFVNTDSGTACTGWLEESTNNGKTWHAVSAFHTIPTRKTAATLAFTARFSDGTGRIARACFLMSSHPGKQHCTASW